MIPDPALQHEQEGGRGESRSSAIDILGLNPPGSQGEGIGSTVPKFPMSLDQTVMASVQNDSNFFPLLSFIFSLLISFTVSYRIFFSPIEFILMFSKQLVHARQ